MVIVRVTPGANRWTSASGSQSATDAWTARTGHPIDPHPRRTVGALLSLVLPLSGASAKSVGGCPESTSDKWQPVTVESLGISPEVAVGIPSLDGNGDGYTCIKPLPGHPAGPDTIIFRDNTV